ncbi:MAG: response regulator transcription factor [Gemmatimonadetes bacterium]|nr:response regulator transcription factor [Gemmatimonadota bacterium]
MTDAGRKGGPPWRALVVDDERLAREGLRDMLAADPELQVTTCASGREAVTALQTGQVDIVFLDIRMRDLDGFGVIAAVGVEQMPVVVFTTAFGAHAIQAFEACALDFVLKPIGDDRLAQAVRRAKAAVRQRTAATVHEQLRALLASHAPASAPRPPTPPIEVRLGTRVFFVDPVEVTWAESADNYVRLWWRGQGHLIRATLAQLVAAHAHAGFLQVHRRALVNLAHVQEVRVGGMRGAQAVLRDGTRVPVSRDRRATVLAALRARTGVPSP